MFEFVKVVTVVAIVRLESVDVLGVGAFRGNQFGKRRYSISLPSMFLIRTMISRLFSAGRANSGEVVTRSECR